MAQDRFRLDGKVALVTGGSRGLGAAMAMALAEAGADVAVHASAQTPSDTCAAVEGLGRRAFPVIADLSQHAASDGLVERVAAHFGRFDILVNNAGLIRRAAAAEHSDEDWDVVLAVDLTAVFRLARAAGQHFLAQKQPGKIVNVASLLSFQGGVRVPSYAAAKGGVAQLTKALANEWAQSRVNVNAIAPGYMATDNTAALQADPVRSRQILERIPAGRWGAAEDLGGAVVFLASPASDYVHGHVMVVDGGWLAR